MTMPTESALRLTNGADAEAGQGFGEQLGGPGTGPVPVPVKLRRGLEHQGEQGKISRT